MLRAETRPTKMFQAARKRALGLYLDMRTPEERVPTAENVKPTTPFQQRGIRN